MLDKKPITIPNSASRRIVQENSNCPFNALNKTKAKTVYNNPIIIPLPIVPPFSFLNAKKHPNKILNTFIIWFIGLINESLMFVNFITKANNKISKRLIIRALSAPFNIVTKPLFSFIFIVLTLIQPHFTKLYEKDFFIRTFLILFIAWRSVCDKIIKKTTRKSLTFETSVKKYQIYFDLVFFILYHGAIK